MRARNPDREGFVVVTSTTGALAAQYGRGESAILEGSGHLSNVRDPAKANLLIRDFVERAAA